MIEMNPRPKAKIVDCPGDHNGYSDHCYLCMPFWMKIPYCPIHEIKLTVHGFCRTCRKYYNIKEANKL
jgi:hypothetical protein